MPEPARVIDRLRGAIPTLSVGILTADLSSLATEVRRIEEAGVAIVHFDVMDGSFCPMMTVGPPLVKAVRSPLLKDVHLMVDDPLGKLSAFVAAGADILTVQVESTRHPHRVLQALGEMTNANDPGRGLLRGLALNPGTPIGAVEPLLDEVEMVTLLAVNPGWGGQKFIPSTARRMQRLKAMIRDSHRNVLTCIDGGVTRENIAEVARMGADVVVTGSAVFDGKAVEANARHMMGAVASGRAG